MYTVVSVKFSVISLRFRVCVRHAVQEAKQRRWPFKPRTWLNGLGLLGKKAPGLDELMAEHLKSGGETMVTERERS